MITTQSVECQILEIDHEKRRLSLGIKQLLPNPWLKFNEANPVGTILNTKMYKLVFRVNENQSVQRNVN